MNRSHYLVRGCLLFTLTASLTLAVPVPPNVRVTNYPQLNNEEQVWICPTDTSVAVANWRDFRLGYRQVGIGRSANGGVTWSDSLINSFQQYFTFQSWQSDPTLVADAAGNFIMSVLDFIPGTDSSVIAYYRSIDKGMTWSGPVAHNPALGLYFEDKQFMAVDRTGGSFDGYLYTAWARFNNPTRIMFVRSIDGGITFDDTVVVGPVQVVPACGFDVDAGQFANPAVNSDGSVHVFWQGFNITDSVNCGGTYGIKHVVSINGGVTFTNPDVAIPEVSGYTFANGSIDTYSQPSVDCDISGGPYDGTIYMLFANQGPEDVLGDTDIDFVRSTDNGVTWSPRVKVNDGPNNIPAHAFHPWMIVNGEGVIAAIFYDQRLGAPTYNNFDVFAVYSFDGGLTFTTNHRVSSASSSPGSLNLESETSTPLKGDDRRGPMQLTPMAGLIGEYIGISMIGDKIVAVWTDSRHGNSEVYSARWYLPVVEPRLIAPADDSIDVTVQPVFTWATSWKENVDSYRHELSLDPLFSVPATTSTQTTSPTLTITAMNELLTDTVYYWRVKAFKLDGMSSIVDSSGYSPIFNFRTETGFICGDVNGNGIGPTVADLTFLVNYLFNSGPPPPVLAAANVNGVGGITVADLTYLVNFLFNSGPAPVCP